MRSLPIAGRLALAALAFGLLTLHAPGQGQAGMEAHRAHVQAGQSALNGDTAGALEHLSTALAAGLKPTLVLADADLVSLKEDPRFRALLKKHATESSATIVVEDEPGEPMWIRAQVVEHGGDPVPGALVYLYHTDHLGIYSSVNDNQNPRIFAYLKTDENGRIQFGSIRPAGYPESTIAQHVHYTISLPGRPDHVSEWFFDDDPRLTEERRDRAPERGFPIISLTREGTGSWRGNVRLPLPQTAEASGERETEPPSDAVAEKQYMCPPCGCEDCGEVYDSPGMCPASDCGMSLVSTS